MFISSPLTSSATPEEFGARGSAHDHAAILVKIFGDEFDFSACFIKYNQVGFILKEGMALQYINMLQE